MKTTRTPQVYQHINKALILNMSLLEIWDKIQPSLKEHLGASTYETWFSAIQIKEKNAQTLVIETPDDFFKNWFEDHFLKSVNERISALSPTNIRIEVAVSDAPSVRHTSPIPEPVPEPRAPKPQTISLNARFSFDNFVVGPSNRFAYSACLAVAESPAKAYNPLFIYGHVGLGKTHLMQAITHEIQKKSPHSTCCYISTEKFTNEQIGRASCRERV